MLYTVPCITYFSGPVKLQLITIKIKPRAFIELVHVSVFFWAPKGGPWVTIVPGPFRVDRGLLFFVGP